MQLWKMSKHTEGGAYAKRIERHTKQARQKKLTQNFDIFLDLKMSKKPQFPPTKAQRKR